MDRSPLAALVGLLLVSGCIARPVEMPPEADPEGAVVAGEPSPRELFAALEGDFVAACAVCHEAGGVASAPFLEGPDRYASVKGWSGVVVPDPEASLLLTYPVKGSGHPGATLDGAPLDKTLLPRLREWLEAEAAASKKPHPMLLPFAPVLGFNAVLLDSLGPGYASIALTFYATKPAPGVLELSTLEVHPTVHAGVRVIHPLFSVLAGGVLDPDPVDSFSELDQVFEVGEPAMLGCGTLILPNWSSGAAISIAFEEIALTD